MPLSDGYGVLIGTIANYYRDKPDDFGKYYHGNLIVMASGREYRCAVDVDSKNSEIGVEWRVLQIKATELSQVTSLGTGYHPLASSPNSGALDYIRSPMFAGRIGCLLLYMGVLKLLRIIKDDFLITNTWKRGTGVDALADLEPLVRQTQERGLSVLIFGEPFRPGQYGMHNIHQNQGDPISSQWAGENGIWQDGCTILQQDAETYVAFMNKFTTQSYWTDDNGRPK
jgi:hypothetical protein